MKLIAGFGNPGEKYERTRHNVGFMAADAIAANFQFPIFNSQSKFNADITEGTIGEKRIVLAKPQTFMNNSGVALKALAQFYKLTPADIIVIHDEIDLPVGTVKVSTASGSAGHKGVESVIENLGTNEFTRIRVGIQPHEGKPNNVEDFVLKRFTAEEEEEIAQAIQDASQKLTDLLL